jgi:ABC-2 type transport system ATP-binding protein
MEPVISVKNLRKNYGSKEVLKGINLTIYPGQVIGYIGPNGAAKALQLKYYVVLLVIMKEMYTLKA